MRPYSFDIISDLNLKNKKDFKWENKATSLFCIVAGNISDDLKIVFHVLTELSKFYSGVFFIDGENDHKTIKDYYINIAKLKKFCDSNQKIIYLHDNVVVLNNTALLACNGWFTYATTFDNSAESFLYNKHNIEDLGYLTNTVKDLQLHPDVKNIILISGSIPETKLHFNTNKTHNPFNGNICLTMDIEKKVSNWIYAGSKFDSEIVLNNIKYISNPNINKENYWPKRVEI